MADYKGLNIRFRGDTSEATKALHVLSSEAKAAQGNLTAIQTALKSSETNGRSLNDALKSLQLQQTGNAAKAASEKVGVYEQSLVKLNERLSAAQQKLVTNRDALETMPAKYDALAASASESFERVAAAQAALEESTQRVEMASGQQQWVQAVNDQAEAQAQLNAAIAAGDEEFKNVATTYGTLEGAVNSAEETIRATGDEIESTTQKMLVQKSQAQALADQYQTLDTSLAAGSTRWGEWGDEAVRCGESLKSVGDAMASVGDKMSIVSGIALMTFGKSTISATEDFGNAISQLGGYLGIGGEQLQDMGDQALDWGKNTRYSATEAADAMNQLAKGGMTQAQISGGAMAATMELAAAGQLDMASAAETAVQAINVFGLEAEDATAVADALAGAANTSTAEVSDLAQGFSQIGSAAGMAGWDLNEVVGALALLADHGFSGAEAGTTLKTTLQRLASPTKKAAETMQSLGINVYDSEGKMVDAMDVIGQFESALDGLTDEQRNKALLDIFGMRGINGMTAILSEGAESFEGYIEATERLGYASEMADAQMGDLGWALEYLRGEAETASVNFGNALAPTIIDVAEAIEDALEWFNNLSAGQQEFIAKSALMVTAAGPVISILGHVASGIGGLVSAAGTGAQTLSTFAQLMSSGTDAASGASSVFHNLASAYAMTTESAENVATATANVERSLQGLATGAAITGVIAVVGMLVTKMADYIEHEQEFEEATEGLHSVIDNLGTSLDGQSDSLSNAAMSWEEIRDRAREANESQKELTQSIDDSYDDVSKSSAMLDEYVGVIEQFADKGSLMAGEQEKLAAAVKGFNDTTGASVSVIDSQSGALDANVESIKAAADAYKEYANVQATMDAYTKVQEKIVETQIEIDRLNEELKNADEGFGLYIGDFAVISDGAKDAYHELEKELAQATERSEELGYASDRLSEMMNGASTSSSEYQSTLESLGLTSGETAGDIASDAEDAADAIEGASETAQDAIDAATTAMKRAHEDAYTALQRQLSDEYDAQKDAYDDEYDALSDALSNEYNTKKTAYDREYDALSDALDAEYDARKSELDREYDSLADSLSDWYDTKKSEYDKQYSLLKKQLDKEYSARKSAYASELSALRDANDAEEAALKAKNDKLYKQRKKELESELSLVRSANDKRLKEQKAAATAETKAFKAETSERVKAIKAEYEARKQAVADNDGRSRIDARIKTLEEQTKAEQKAIKKAQEEEKKAELQKAVDQAKTRKTRENAEKALNEYLAELAQEAREEEREAEIARLEERKSQIADETEAKQNALDVERDARIAAYEQQREDELTALQARQDAVYESMSANYDRQEELIAERHATELENYRAYLDSLLQALRDENDAEETDMAERHAAKLEVLAEHNATLLEQRKAQNESELELIKQQNEDALEALKSENDAELAQIKSNNEARLQNLKDEQEAELAATKANNDAILDNLKESQESALKDLKRSNEDRLTELKRAQEDELENLKKTLKNADKAVAEGGKKIDKTGREYTKKTVKDISDESDKVPPKMYKVGTDGTISISRGMDSKRGQVKTTTKSLYDDVMNKLNQLPGAANTKGGASISSFSSGMGSKRSDARGVAKAISDDVKESLTLNMRNGGSDVGTTYGDGIGSAYSYVKGSASELNNAAEWELEGLQWSTHGWGSEAGYNFGSGLSSAYSYVYSAASSLANAVSRLLHHTTPEEGPMRDDDTWGSDFIDNYINGMKSREAALAREANRIAGLIQDEFADNTVRTSLNYDVTHATKMLANGVNEALRSGVGHGGVTIVMNGLTVREEADIDRIGEQVTRRMNQRTRRSLACTGRR